AGEGRGEDQPGNERRRRAHAGEAERRRRAAGQADLLPSLGREGRRAADDEPERSSRTLRVRGDLVQARRGEGARRREVTFLKLTLEYDGTNFVGWQVQPNGRSVQEELEKGIARLCGGPVRLTGAGRTDAGVHARGQIASLGPPRALPLKAWTSG